MFERFMSHIDVYASGNAYAFKNVYSPYGNLNSNIEYKLELIVIWGGSC